MTKVKVFCSIRTDEDGTASIQLFSDLRCAEIDQTLQAHYKNLGKKFISSFIIEVTGVAYVDAVMTVGEYKRYLEEQLINNPNATEIKTALQKL